MTKETKIGLLVGMGVIILIGILISDHLSVAQRQQQAQLANGIPEISQDMIPPPPQVARDLYSAQATRRTEPMPLPDELPATVTRETTPAPAPAPSAAAANPRVQVAAADPKPHTIYQDVTTLLDERPPSEPVIPSQPAAVTGYRPIPSDPGTLPPGFEVVSAQPAARLAAPVHGTKEIVHYVGKEETLSDISRKYYGTAGAWKDIYEANRNVIPNPNLVRPGVRLVIPPKPGTPSANVAAAASGGSHNSGTAIRITAERPAPAPAMKTYTVQSGDTLSEIASRFTGSAANWKKVYAANKDRIKDPDRLSEGTVLQIPAN